MRYTHILQRRQSIWGLCSCVVLSWALWGLGIACVAGEAFAQGEGAAVVQPGQPALPALPEDPLWLRYAQRGQAFAHCPDSTPSVAPLWAPPPAGPVKKGAPGKKRSRGSVVKKSSVAPSAGRGATGRGRGDCPPPILVPIPILPKSPQSAPPKSPSGVSAPAVTPPKAPESAPTPSAPPPPSAPSGASGPSIVPPGGSPAPSTGASGSSAVPSSGILGLPVPSARTLGTPSGVSASPAASPKGAGGALLPVSK